MFMELAGMEFMKTLVVMRPYMVENLFIIKEIFFFLSSTFLLYSSINYSTKFFNSNNSKCEKKN